MARTSRGVPVADTTIERLAREAEAGYDPAQLKRRPGRPAKDRPSVVIQARLEPDLYDALLLQAAGTTVSNVVREALRAYLKASARKAGNK